MENNENREFVVIVSLSEELAERLNTDNIGGCKFGIECRCNSQCKISELNKDDQRLHGIVKSRVFYIEIENYQPNAKCEVFMEDRTGEEKKTIASVSFVIPDNREFEIVELGNPGKVLSEVIMKKATCQ